MCLNLFKDIIVWSNNGEELEQYLSNLALTYHIMKKRNSNNLDYAFAEHFLRNRETISK